MNLVTSTATVFGDPVVEGDAVKFSAAANESYVNNEGAIARRTLSFFIAYNGRDKDEIVPLLKSNARVAFSGYFTGPSYVPNEQYPNSSSINGPTIFNDEDGKPFTALCVVAQSLKVIGPVVKKITDFDDVTNVTLAGVLGRDPEMQYTNDAKPLTKNSIAAQRLYFTGEGDERQTHKVTCWFRLTIWGAGAQPALQWWKKRRGLIVTGSPSVDKETHAPKLWQHSQTQEWRASYDLNVYTWEFAPGKNGNGRTVDSSEYSESPADQSAKDIPF